MKISKKIIIYTTLILLCIITMIPLLFILSNSFMTPKEITNRYTSIITPYNIFDVINDKIHYVRLSFLPDFISLDGYKTLFLKSDTYIRHFLNSVIIVFPIILGQVIIAPLAAYSFERMRFKYKEAIYLIFVVVMILPTQVVSVYHFIIINLVGIENDFLKIILPAVFSPFGVFLCRQYLKNLPKDFLEAAEIDGANDLSIFTSMILPNIKPVLSSLVILTFVEYWNLVDQAFIFIKDQMNFPLSIFLSSIAEGDIGMFFATSVFYLILPILIFLYGQEDILAGVTLSAVK